MTSTLAGNEMMACHKMFLLKFYAKLNHVYGAHHIHARQGHR